MMIIRPLEKNYTVVRVWVTDLESFLQCPYKQKHTAYEKTAQKDFGTKAHDMFKHFLYNKNHYSQIRTKFVDAEQDPMHRKLLQEYMDLASDLPENLVADVKIEYPIECWLYLVNVVWKLDSVDINLNIRDQKTSDGMWKEWEEKDRWKLQPYFYPEMYFGDNRTETDFYYDVFTKHKRDPARMESRVVHITREIAIDIIKRVIVDYIVAYHSNKRQAKNNIYCKGCPAYKDNTCPLHFTSYS